MRQLALTTIALALCAGCSQEKSDLEHVRASRSVLAEWALVAEMRAILPDVYVRQMRQAAQGELGKVAALANQGASPASRAISEVAGVRGDPPPSLLHARVRAAQAIERSLETR